MPHQPASDEPWTLGVDADSVKGVSEKRDLTFMGYDNPVICSRKDSMMLGGAFDYTSCRECGTSVGLDGLEPEQHRCDNRHRLEHVLRLAVAEVELFEPELREYLESAQGRFEVFYAARTRSA